MSHEVFQLENDQVLLDVVPAFGARVTSLLDRRSGRQWLVPGPLEGEQNDAAIFGAKQARGWDECFPTVAPCASASWKKSLRDHGELWGRPWTCSRDLNSVTAEYTTPDYRFQRRLVLEGASVTARYELENLANAAFPYLWSQHCLLNAQPGERIVLSGIGDLQSDAGAVDWPVDQQGQDQSVILASQAGFFQKAYAPVIGHADVGIDAENGSIRFTWNVGDAGYFGLWRDYGGWPADDPVHQIALEPTTAPADDLVSAKSGGNECWLHPGETRRWAIGVHLHH